jgi:hypothetical protein
MEDTPVHMDDVRDQRLNRLEEHARSVELRFEAERERLRIEYERLAKERALLDASKAEELKEPWIPKNIRIPSPDTYDGDPLKLGEWIFQLKNFFALSKARDTAVQVQLAIAFLRGTALSWWRSLKASELPLDFDSFEVAICLQFKIDDEARVARDMLAKITQKGTVPAYSKYFRALLLKIPDMTDAEARDRYMRGLKPQIAREVLLRDCTSLNDMIRIAERFDMLYRNYQVNRYNQPSPAPVQADIMDVDSIILHENHLNESRVPRSDQALAAVRSENPNRPLNRVPLTDAERQALSRSKSCFYCRQQGHFKRNCPLRPDPNRGNGVERQ